MQHGALAMFDALGFKGVWRRVERPEMVVDKLKALQQGIDDYVDGVFGGKGRPLLRALDNTLASVSTCFLSDTVAVAVVPKRRDELHEALRESVTDDHLAASAIAYAATLSGDVYRAALLSEPAWSYRGCIAYGEFYLDDRFLVGEAVDEAADHMDGAEGAFVWLTPSAKEAFEKSPGGFGGRCTPLAPYSVPCKGEFGAETVSATFVASPFPWQPTLNQGKEVVAALLRTFDGVTKERVVRKARNTQAFLEHHVSELRIDDAELKAMLERLGGRSDP